MVSLSELIILILILMILLLILSPFIILCLYFMKNKNILIAASFKGFFVGVLSGGALFILTFFFTIFNRADNFLKIPKRILQFESGAQYYEFSRISLFKELLLYVLIFGIIGLILNLILTLKKKKDI